MYLTGKAKVWFDSYIMQKNKVTWHEFMADLCHRFVEKNMTDVVKEFNKLQQRGFVEDYQTKFEELQPYILQMNPEVKESYFVSSFVSGLKEELKHRVKVHDPPTLAAAFRQAQLYELAMEVENRKHRYQTKGTGNLVIQKRFNNANVQRKFQPPVNPKQSLLDYRRANNLCFKCGERFSPGH